LTDKSVFRRDTGTLEIVLFYEERSLSVQTQNDRDTQERSNNGKKIRVYNPTYRYRQLHTLGNEQGSQSNMFSWCKVRVNYQSKKCSGSRGQPQMRGHNGHWPGQRHNLHSERDTGHSRSNESKITIANYLE